MTTTPILHSQLGWRERAMTTPILHGQLRIRVREGVTATPILHSQLGIEGAGGRGR